MVVLGPIEIGEIKLIKFDFAGEAGDGVTLLSPTVVCTVHKGTDPSPASVLFGAAVISGTELHQMVQPGVSGTTYKLRASVIDSATLRHGMTGLLEVTTG